MTESARQALVGLRDFSTLQWYVVPFLALLFYIYLVEIRSARQSGNWDAVVAGVCAVTTTALAPRSAKVHPTDRASKRFTGGRR